MRMVCIGVTALRDPLTQELLPAVPLYVAAADVEASGALSAIGAPLDGGNAIGALFAGKHREYINAAKKETRRQKAISGS